LEALEASTDSDYDASWNPCIHVLLQSARSSTIARNKKGREIEAVTLTPNDVKEMFRDQRGRGAYSDITFTKDGPWTMSLERLDNTRGYTRENVTLICKAFNSRDVSHITEGGCRSLNREKVQAFIASYREHEDWVKTTIAAIRLMKK
jgi:hypothetical protein